jgi:hypothetical protein
VSGLPVRIAAVDTPFERRALWAVVRLDSYATLPGDIIDVDTIAGTAKMRERGPDEVDKDGLRKPTWREVSYDLACGIQIVWRRR